MIICHLAIVRFFARFVKSLYGRKSQIGNPMKVTVNPFAVILSEYST